MVALADLRCVNDSRDTMGYGRTRMIEFGFMVLFVSGGVWLLSWAVKIILEIK